MSNKLQAVNVEILASLGATDPVGVYERIANIGGYGVVPGYRPTFDLTGLDGAARDAVDRVIADALPAATKTTKKDEEK